MKAYTFDEALDRHFGEKGTPRRDDFEAEAEEALHAYRLGAKSSESERNGSAP